jgi:hypothetical protein
MKPLVIHEVFVPGGNFHIGKLFKHSGNTSFHLAVWKAINDPTSVKSFTMEFMVPAEQRYDHGDRMHALLFRSEKDLAQFTSWWQTYSKRFGDDDLETCKNAYPILKEGEHINGYAFKHGLGSNSDNRRGFHDWAWLVANTTGKVTFSGEYWIFEDEAEMVQLKLRGKPDIKRGFDYMELLKNGDPESYADHSLPVIEITEHINDPYSRDDPYSLDAPF